jgi:hypothetical protein
MGLDSYLKATKYVSGYDDGNKNNSRAVRDILHKADLPATLRCDEAPSVEVSFTIAYWRKANCIHNWFVKNVQGGVDECQVSPVRREQLEALRELCENVLVTRDATLLPPASGFFFGSTEIDDWYWSDVAKTAKVLRVILEAPALKDCRLLYKSSW